ncbi:MAG: hypothetical protein ACJ79H_21185 [Myxococcales bacterium]
MALQIPFFMAPEDERDVLRRIARLELELWPEVTDPGHRAPLCAPETELVDPAYYFAAGDVIAYPLKRGQNRGRWKIDEVKSPVIYFFRSQMDEEGQLRSGYFWAETETAGDQSRTGGKPSRFLHAVRELQDAVKSRFRRSSPVKGTIYFVGPGAARLAQSGTPLREAGRKGELVRVYR